MSDRVYLLLPVLLFCAPDLARASALDEFKIKRERVFAFAEKPVLTRDGDNVTIRFETQGFCDVTVVIENAKGRILRHLASGVLGDNAPPPFAKSSKKQTLLWDGKDDTGKYVDDKDGCIVRVSLGLKPRFEKTLFWSPHKRAGIVSPVICPTPDGVYIAEGCGRDFVRKFDHQGNYLHTVYPFPREKLAQVKGLDYETFPQDGAKLPLKKGSLIRATLLPSGTSAGAGKICRGGQAAKAMAVHGTRIALAYNTISWLSTDGSTPRSSSGQTGGLSLKGQRASIDLKVKGGAVAVAPRSAAFDPQGKWVYFTGYEASGRGIRSRHLWVPCVMRMNASEGGKLECFAGSTELKDATSPSQAFKVPLSVACDAGGRVYVADYANNRIQVYKPDGKLFKSIPATYPVHIDVHPQTGEIYVYSWTVLHQFMGRRGPVATYFRLGSVDEKKPGIKFGPCPLPLIGHSRIATMNIKKGLQFRVATNFWDERPTTWLIPGDYFSSNSHGEFKMTMRGTGLSLLREDKKGLKLIRDFSVDATRKVKQIVPPVAVRQRLYVNPVDGMCYVGEINGQGFRTTRQLVKLDPKTGAVKLVNLPVSAKDMAIGTDGYFYLRDGFYVGRFDPRSWREVPFDYGEERKACPKSVAPLISGIRLPATGGPPWGYFGGMAVSPKGHVAVTCMNTNKPMDWRYDAVYWKQRAETVKSGYKPSVFPGRRLGWEIHVWDRHGKILYKDAAPGVGFTYGIGMDKDDHLYAVLDPHRSHEGKAVMQHRTSTLARFAPQKVKLLTRGGKAGGLLPLPLGPNQAPDRPRDLGQGWLENADWMYGEVGYAGRGSCVCWNHRAALDLLGRSFAPEVLHYSVAVLDTNGNLILRVGRYGNVEDGKPLDPSGGPKKTRSIGGDEVALFHAPYVASHTDKRLFIADPGNDRILSVKLDYHANHTTSLRMDSSSK